MESIAPFGSGNTSTMVPQKFMGATVAKFDCSADYSSQPGSCNIVLVQDDTDGDLFVPGVIGSPQYFTITDDGAVVFQFNGVLDSISRDTSAGDKSYKVTLASPLKILDAVTVILEGYTGFGSTTEGLPQFYSDDGYYTVADSDKQVGYLPDGVSMTPSVDYFKTAPFSFSNNNANLSFTGMWERMFNLLNVFAAYENEYVGPNGPVGVTPYAGYGASSSVKGGMRVDKVAYALDQIINHTAATSSRRYIGGNLLYGTNTYNVCATAGGYVAPFPYYYGFDIISFVSSLFYYLPEDFILPGPSLTLTEIVSTLCDIVNADFIVNLDSGATYQAGLFAATMSQTYPNSIFGGIISITIIPRNEYVNCSRPFSNFTYDLINLERPDQGDYQSSGNINPGTLVAAVGIGANNPLDLDYAFRGTEGSYPHGGTFPVETGANSQGVSYTGTRASDISVSLKATPGTVGKMVVGGYQSRMNVVPRDYIYQYWGEITLVGHPIDTCGVNSTSQKSIPVITQILPANDTWDWVAIDMQDLFSNTTVPGLIYKGVYFASVMEIRAAAVGEWESFMRTFKKTKLQLIRSKLVTTIAQTPSDEYSGSISRYMSMLNTDIEVNIKTIAKKTGPSTIVSDIENKVKAIHDNYYGKEWIAPVPVMRTKITSSQENLVGNFERSWDIADDAYVEPYAFGSLEAPKDASFMNNGRLKAYVNFEHSFPGTAGNIGYDLITGGLTGFVPGVNYKYDFTSYNKSDVVFDINPSTSGTDACPIIGLAHVGTTISKEYTMITPSYFSYYNRGNCPFVDTIDYSGQAYVSDPSISGGFFCYTYAYPQKDIRTDKIFESFANDANSKTYFNQTVVDNLFSQTSTLTNETEDYVFYPCNQTLFDTSPADCEWSLFTTLQSGQISNLLNTATRDHFAWTYSGTALLSVLDGISSASLGYEGSGLPFVRFSTEKVYYPDTCSHDGINPITGAFLDALETVLIKQNFSDLSPIQSKIQSRFSKGFASHNGAERACVAPRSVAIPQQSNRYTYGP